MAAGPPPPIVLTPAERTTLERWARGRRIPRRLVRRARIILQAAAGLSTAAIARACRTDRECVGRWRARFVAARVGGLQHEAPRTGRPPRLPAEVLQALTTALATTVQPDGRPWSLRSLARFAGVSPATIQRVCQANGLAPHWVWTLRLRRPFPGFTRLNEVLGGYLTDWDSALVLGGDAVSPHRPAPPPRPPRPDPRGLPARYAVKLPPLQRHIAAPAANRIVDWLQFLAHVAARVPRDRWVHVFVDTWVPSQHPAVGAWVARHPRLVLHLVPAGQPLPLWFRQALQGWVDRQHPPPPLPSYLQAKPRWLVQASQQEERRRRPSLRPVESLRAAVSRLRPRSARRKSPSVWMASRDLVRMVVGNPRWHLPPDPARVRPPTRKASPAR